MFSLLTNMKLSLFVVFGSLYFLQFASFVSSKTNDFKSAIEARINIVNNSGSTIKRLHELSNNLNNNSWTPGFPQTNPGSNTNPGTNPNSPAATYLDIQNAMYILDKLLNELNSRPSANSPAVYAVRDRIRTLQTAINQPNSALTLAQIQFAIITMVLALQSVPYELPGAITYPGTIPVPNPRPLPVVPPPNLAATAQEIANLMSQLNNLQAQVNAVSPVSANDPAANQIRQSIQQLYDALSQPNTALTSAQIQGAISTIISALQQFQAPNNDFGTTLAYVNNLLGNLLATLGLGGLNTLGLGGLNAPGRR